MLLNVAIALSCVLTISPQVSDYKPYLIPKTPVLVLIGPRHQVVGSLPVWNRLLTYDAIQDYEIKVHPVFEESSIELIRWLRSRLSLSETVHWVLIGKDGQAAAYGEKTPVPEAFIEGLELGWEVTPATKLIRFLKNNQAHSQARSELVYHLAKRCSKVVSRIEPKGMDALSNELDRSIWAGLAAELDILFSDNAWAYVPTANSFVAILPNDLPEKRSSLMKSLYRRQKPKVIALLHEIPEHQLAWMTLSRMNRVLEEESIISLFTELILFRTSRDTAIHLPSVIARSVYEEAKLSGKWQQAVPALRYLWEQNLKSMDDFDFHPITIEGVPVFSASAQSRKRQELVLMNAWKFYLSPLLEALVLSNAEGEASLLLGSLDDRWSLVSIHDNVMKLAKAMKKNTLEMQWGKLTNKMAIFMPTSSNNSDYIVFYQPDDQSFDFTPLLQKYQIGIESVNVEWRRHLGWGDSGQRWALVAPSGRVLVEGKKLPTSAELAQSLNNVGLKPYVEEIISFLNNNPKNLSALKCLAKELNRVGFEKSAVRANVDMNEMVVANESRLDQYLATLTLILENDYGLIPPSSTPLSGIWPRGRFGNSLIDLKKKDNIAQFSTRWISYIEETLAKWPTDENLWQAWIFMSRIIDRPLRPVIDGIVPSPMYNSKWPPIEVKIEYVKMLLSEERWEEVESQLNDDWKQFQLMMENRGNDGTRPGSPSTHVLDAWNHLFEPLVQSFLHQGKFEIANQMINSWACWEIQPGDMGPLCKSAEQMQQGELCQSWKKILRKYPAEMRDKSR